MELTFVDVKPGDPAMTAEVGPLIRALRPALTADGFAAFAAEAHDQGVVFTAALDARERYLGVATHRVLTTSRGRTLLVDDMVTALDARGAGVGTRLLAELETRARAAGCERLELDAGVANHGAHRFYHAHRMAITALHFARELT
ncbi:MULTISPECIES: GNAT family N-acetyltransferase [Streptomycetaceae]|uniref:GNAT family N-acetyltransferase n=1 Tax=Streptomycetaceae TaxID=2062 RepID=UPI00035E34EA|nr:MULTISPECIES: GNAT family N-acetyltransferase [Streptomycetaceae]MYX36078.1 GNAT family N-acetyltransferase [Streptomyces sp. SID8377]